MADDLQADQNLKRIDELESFKSEYEGINFYEKIKVSILKSVDIQTEIKKLAWQTMKDKLIWFFFGALGTIIIDLLLRAIPHIISNVS